MARYQTEQRAVLSEIVSARPHEALSAREIARLAAGRGVSLSAVYRNLAEMTKAGLLQKISRAGSREAFYRYTGVAACRDHIHLSCTRCGKIVPLEADALAPLIRSADEEEGFAVDCAGSVLVGVCGACRKGEGRA